MKSPIIFSICLLLFFFGGCAFSDKLLEADEESPVISSSYEHWFSTAPGETEFSERGIDLRLELHQNSKIFRPEYIIFNERMSFPAEVSWPDDDEDKIVIKARILLESSLFSEISRQSELSDRLVFRDDEGELQYVEISNWERLPDRYN